MKKKCMEWIGPERQVPGYGVMTKGTRKEWPADLVDDFVSQGLAIKIPSLKGERALENKGGES